MKTIKTIIPQQLSTTENLNSTDKMEKTWTDGQI